MSNPLATLTALRRLLLGILMFGLAGTAADLLLIGHDEDAWQLLPLVMTGIAAIVAVGLAVTSSTSPRASAWIRTLQTVMVLLILTGLLGMILHYRANMEFKLEMDPTLSGFALFSSVVRATAPPALAPATLVLLGLVGLACAFRRRADPSSGNR
jgi:hypothetical protein